MTKRKNDSFSSVGFNGEEKLCFVRSMFQMVQSQVNSTDWLTVNEHFSHSSCPILSLSHEMRNRIPSSNCYKMYTIDKILQLLLCILNRSANKNAKLMSTQHWEREKIECKESSTWGSDLSNIYQWCNFCSRDKKTKFCRNSFATDEKIRRYIIILIVSSE